MSALLELADRCEAATGPDRELDAEIHDAVFPITLELPRYPRYTVSLDAAITLVPERWHWSVYDTNGVDKAAAQLEPPEYSFCPINGEAKTPALSFCAAALRARAILEGEG